MQTDQYPKVYHIRKLSMDYRSVLIHDTEAGETTRAFIVALQKQLPKSKFKDFRDADENERDSLDIFAVVRHFSPRISECLNSIQEQLYANHVYDFRRVVVIYFSDLLDETTSYNIRDTSKTGLFSFAEIVLMDFSNQDLKTTSCCCRVLKTENENALKTLKLFIKSRNTRQIRVEKFVDGFFAMSSQQCIVERFVAELGKHIPKSINLQNVRHIDELTDDVNYPTLIFTNHHLNGCQETKLSKKDQMKIVVINIIDLGDAERPDIDDGHISIELAEFMAMPCQQYRQIWKVIHYNGKFYTDMDFHANFQKFVHTCPT